MSEPLQMTGPENVHPPAVGEPLNIHNNRALLGNRLIFVLNKAQ